MIDLECPNCGGGGSIPNDKKHIRLVCKKCHFVFHLDPTGRAKAGEPPEDNSTRHQEGRVGPAASHRVRLEDMPSLEFDNTARSKAMLGLLGVIVVGAIVYWFMSGPGESLADATIRIADAMAQNKPAALKAMAVTGSEDDLIKAFQEIINDLETMKKDSTTQELIVTTMVSEENRRQKMGVSAVFFAPKSGSTRDESIASQARGARLKRQAVDVNLNWTVDASGRWKLDGHRLLQSVGTGP